jgi:hypothetical protein
MKLPSKKWLDILGYIGISLLAALWFAGARSSHGGTATPVVNAFSSFSSANGKTSAQTSHDTLKRQTIFGNDSTLAAIGAGPTYKGLPIGINARNFYAGPGMAVYCNSTTAAVTYQVAYPWVDASQYASLQAAAAAIGSVNPTVLYITTPQTVGVSTVLTANITVVGLNTGLITINNAVTLTVNGPSDNLYIAGVGNIIYNGVAIYRGATIGNSGTITFNAIPIIEIYKVITGNGTVSLPLGTIAHAEWWGTLGPAIQSAINAVANGSTIYIDSAYTTTTSYNLTNRSNLHITGKGSIAIATGNATLAYIFQMIGTLDKIEIDSLTLTGEANTSYSQYGIGQLSGQTITGAYYHDLKVSNLNLGISITGIGGVVERNIVSNIVGTGTGQGYGIHSDSTQDLVVAFNKTTNCQRHDIYTSKPNGAVIGFNISRGHRSGGVATGTYTVAIPVSRGNHVLVIGNEIYDSYDGAIGVQHETASSLNCSDITVVNNKMVNRKNAVGSLYIGEQLLPSGYTTSNVIVHDNQIISDESVSTGGAEIVVFNGSLIKFHHNSIQYSNPTSGALLLNLSGTYANAGDLAACEFNENTFKFLGASPGNLKGINFSTPVVTGTAHIDALRNKFLGFGASDNPYVFQVTQTNPYLLFDQASGQRYGTYTAGATTPSVYGITSMLIANSGSVTITNLTDGMEGQIVTLLFADSNTTINNAGNFKIGSSITSANNVILTLVFRSATWQQVSRSIN